MYFVKTPAILQHLVPSIVWKLETVKTIYLTFDDGPCPEITPWVLNVLAENDTKGTFFCLGRQIEKHPEIFDRIKKEGHTVGNHTYQHLDGWKTDVKFYVEDVKKADVLIQSKLFRPPYGRITPSQKKHLSKDYKIIMWDILSGDFDDKVSIEKLYQNVISNVEDGSIIVFHDNLKAAKKLKVVLPQIIAFFKEVGIKCQAL